MSWTEDYEAWEVKAMEAQHQRYLMNASWILSNDPLYRGKVVRAKCQRQRCSNSTMVYDIMADDPNPKWVMCPVCVAETRAANATDKRCIETLSFPVEESIANLKKAMTAIIARNRAA